MVVSRKMPEEDQINNEIAAGRRAVTPKFEKFLGSRAGRILTSAALYGSTLIGTPVHAQADYVEPTPILNVDYGNEHFSQSELDLLDANFNRAISFISDHFGSQLIDNKVVFRKDSTGKFTGDGINTQIARKLGSDNQPFVEVKLRQVDEDNMWELNHQIGHVFLTIGFFGLTSDPAENKFLNQLTEGVAEALAYSLSEGQIDRWNTRMGIDMYLSAEGEPIRRSEDDLPFLRSRISYDKAAARVISLERRFPNFLKDLISVYSQRANSVLDPETRAHKLDINLADFSYLAMIDRLEIQYPGLKAAMREEALIVS